MWNDIDRSYERSRQGYQVISHVTGNNTYRSVCVSVCSQATSEVSGENVAGSMSEEDVARDRRSNKPKKSFF